MAKRSFDIIFALIAIAMTLAIVVIAGLLIWAQDGHWPLYRGLRVGRHGRDFGMLKLRTMVPEGDRKGGSSTAASDARLTPLGAALRKFKVDELPQFWNVLAGQMSVVGPRPNVRSGGVDRYTQQERELLRLRPGITDIASIVFSDEGEILKGSADPDAMYEQLIRPWKNRLGLLYIEHCSLGLDVELIALTILNLIARRAVLHRIDAILHRWNASGELRHVCARSAPLPAGLPPGQIA